MKTDLGQEKTNKVEFKALKKMSYFIFVMWSSNVNMVKCKILSEDIVNTVLNLTSKIIAKDKTRHKTVGNRDEQKYP